MIFIVIRKNMNQSRLTYISLFSSAGIGCYGFKMNNFECIATNELLIDRLNIQRANHKCKYDSGYILGDITTDDVKNRLREEIRHWEQLESTGQVDVVFATPPCQGMSTVNYKKTESEKKRNSLVVEAIELIKEISPKIFVFENVRAFMKTICTDISGVDMPIEDSIQANLSQEYNIFSKIINFKDYGVPSSRPRTLVIGTHKSLINISPLNLFPQREKEITLRDAIGQFPSLQFGEKDATDFLHFARPFPKYMIEWIDNLKEGESAFNNPDEKKPFKLNKIGEKQILKGSYMGNKYRRLFWDKPCSCIATRNDQLASQDTIHPTDNRVLSIRELMKLMTIPDNFVWTTEDSITTPQNSDLYLKKNELNIRRCIGEAVPTHIIDKIANNIRVMLQFENFVELFYQGKNPTLDESNFYISTFIKEQNITNAKKTGAFYTPQSVVFNSLKSVSCKKATIRILEPSVGLGAFLPQIASLFSEADAVLIDAIEIDYEVITQLKETLNTLNLGVNIKINYIIADFLDYSITHQYDYIFTNPPYAKATKKYKDLPQAHKIKNLFALFMLHFFNSADDIICVIPKNFIMADEFEYVRTLYQEYPIQRICDFGVKYFKKVFIEIISIHFSKKYSGHLTVCDFVNNHTYIHPQGYIFHDRVWLLYRNSFFDSFIKSLSLNIFKAFRDRQITNQKLKETGRYRILRSKNILEDGSIISIKGYDKYLDEIEGFAVSKYLNSQSIIMPNFTYNTRATILPHDTLPNGSIAILIPIKKISKVNLSFYATQEFREYYAIVKSYSRFTLNIDNCSLYYIGIQHE